MSGAGAPDDKPVDCHELRVAVVAARWHTQVMDGLLAGARRALDEPVARDLHRVVEVALLEIGDRSRLRVHGERRGRLLDVSSGGLCFVGPVAFRENTRVQVEIAVPRRGAVAVEGAVRHKRPFEQPSSGRRGWATGLESLGRITGHLANATAAEILAALDRSRLRHVIAAHLSQTNNLPRLATAALAGVLGCAAEEIVVAEQARGFDWLALS